ncbi:MAG: sulfide-dependent adenosine diphosphate thiazole synthase [Fervidicoccaceae archaeon]
MSALSLASLQRVEPLEAAITRIIVEHASREWAELSSVDVVVVGAGPSGMVTAKYTAEAGLKTVIFERRLSFGGGIGGGGMLFHKIVVEEEAKEVLDDFGIRARPSGVDGLYVVDAAEFMAKLAAGAIDAGAKIIHGVTVDDVIYRPDPLEIKGVAIQWTAVTMAGLHVDPLFVWSRAVVDATGHDAEVVSVASRKIPELALRPRGEKSAHAAEGERLVVENTGRLVPGLYVTGMAVAAVHGTPRMGPIFGAMLLSGKRVARRIIEDLRS